MTSTSIDITFVYLTCISPTIGAFLYYYVIGDSDDICLKEVMKKRKQ